MALFNNKLFLFSLVWTGFFVRVAISEACYYPDGIQATDNTPCHKNGSVSVCCGPGFTCLSNGLCQQGQNLFRGTCTDSTWKSDACPRFCKSGRQLDNWMSSCPSLGSGHFCCGSDNSCCKNSTLILDIGSGTVISTASSTSTSTTTSTLVSTSSIQTTETTKTTSQQSTSTMNSSQTTTTSVSTPSTHVDDNHGSGTNVAVVAGISIGVGIPVCAGIAAFIFFFCRRRRRQIASDESASHFKFREVRPPTELESNAPRSEIASTALYELPTTKG